MFLDMETPLDKDVDYSKISSLTQYSHCRVPIKIFCGYLLRNSKIYMGFPSDSSGKESACNVGDLGSIPGLGRSPGEGNGNSLQYPSLENSLDCLVRVVTESDMTEQLPLHFTGCSMDLEMSGGPS